MVRLPAGWPSTAFNSLAQSGPGGPVVARPIQRTDIFSYSKKVTRVTLQPAQAQTTLATTPALVQVVPFSTYQTSPTPVTIAPTGTGHTLVVAMVLGNSGSSIQTITGITLGGSADNFGSSAAVAAGGLTGRVEWWLDPGCASGQTAVSITQSTATGAVLTGFVYEFSGVLTTSPLDRNSQNPGITSGTTWSSNTTATTTESGELAVGIGGVYTATGPPTLAGPPPPWINETQTTINFSATNYQTAITGYEVLSGTGTATYSGTTSITNGGAGAAGVITLKPGTTGATGQVTIGPQSVGTVWYPVQVTVNTTTGATDTSTFTCYLGPLIQPTTQVGSLPFSGGFGTIALAIPSMTPGQTLIGIWTGGHAGDAATMNVIGSMDALTT